MTAFLILGCALLFAAGFLAGAALGDRLVNRRPDPAIEPTLVKLGDALGSRRG